MEKKGAQKEMKEEREGKMPNPYRLSHFVAPLYVAPSPTPGNANPRASQNLRNVLKRNFKIRLGSFALLGVVEGAT